MTGNFEQTDATQVRADDTDQRAKWIVPEVVRLSAGSAELDFNGPDDGLGQTS